MHIAIFSFHFPPEKDAEGYVSAKFVNVLSNLGHSVLVYKNENNNSVNSISTLFHSLLQYWKFALLYKCFDLTQLAELNNYVSCSLHKFKVDHKNKPFDLIVSRYEPIASSIAAYWAHKYTNLSWISSINDPFPRLVIPRKGVWHYWDLHRNKFQVKWANDLYQTSTRLVFPSEYLAEWCLQCCNKNRIELSNWDNKVTIIPHIGGPIERPIEHAKFVNPRNRSVIIRHIGYLSKARDISSFIEALILLDLDETLPAITVEFIGNNAGQMENLSSGKIGNLKKNQIHILPAIDNQEAFIKMAEADICLLVEEPGENSKYLPSKFCDYAMAKTPILALTPKVSVVRNYINNYGGGICVDHGNVIEISKSIKAIINNSIDTSRLANEFSLEIISNKWQNILEDL